MDVVKGRSHIHTRVTRMVVFTEHEIGSAVDEGSVALGRTPEKKN
jgi:hypothetical protein